MSKNILTNGKKRYIIKRLIIMCKKARGVEFVMGGKEVFYDQTLGEKHS